MSKKLKWLEKAKFALSGGPDVDSDLKAEAKAGLKTVRAKRKDIESLVKSEEKAFNSGHKLNIPLPLSAFYGKVNAAKGHLSDAETHFDRAIENARGRNAKPPERPTLRREAKIQIDLATQALKAAEDARAEIVREAAAVSQDAMQAGAVAKILEQAVDGVPKVRALQANIRKIGAVGADLGAIATEADTLSQEITSRIALLEADLESGRRDARPSEQEAEDARKAVAEALERMTTLYDQAMQVAAGQRLPEPEPGDLSQVTAQAAHAEALRKKLRDSFNEAYRKAYKRCDEWEAKVCKGIPSNPELVTDSPYEKLLPVYSAFSRDFQAIYNASESESDSAVTADQYQTAYDKAMKKLAEVNKEIDVALLTAEIEAAKYAERLEEAKKYERPYRRHMAAIEEYIGRLKSWDAAAAKGAATLERLKADIEHHFAADRSYKTACSKAENLEKVASDMWRWAEEGAKAAVDDAMKALGLLRADLKTLDPGLCRTAHKAIESRVATYEDLLKRAPHPEAAKAVADEVAADRRFVAAYLERGKDLKDLRERVMALSRTVRGNAPIDALKNEITETVNAVIGETGDMPVDQAMAAWRDLEKRLQNQFQPACDRVKTLRKALSRALGDAKPLIEYFNAAVKELMEDKLDQKADRLTRVYQGDLALAVDQARFQLKSGTDPDRMDAVLRELVAQIERAKPAVLDGDARYRLMAEHADRMEVIKGQRRQVEFMNKALEQAVKEFEASMKAARKSAAGVKEATAALDRVQEDVDKARKALSIGWGGKLSNIWIDVKRVFGDYDNEKVTTGIEITRDVIIRLRAGKRDVDEIARNPMASRGPSRNKADITTIGRDWRSALEEADKKDLAELRRRITALCEPLGEEGKAVSKAAQAQIETVLNLFDPAAFDRAAGYMASNIEAADKLRAREQALAAVRAQRALFDHPLVKQVMNNPFGLKKILVMLKRRLAVIEYKIVVHDCGA